MDGNKFSIPQRYKISQNSLWPELLKLVSEYKPLDLGMGFPDFAPAEQVSSALQDVAKDDDIRFHQYARSRGHPHMVKQLSILYSKLIGRQINELTEVMVTSGAFEALHCSILGHVDEGDEVIIIEPYFDCYSRMVQVAGGVPRFIPLRPSGSGGSSTQWSLDENELTSLFNEKTKMILLNTPNNPLGKVFRLEELEVIAKLCRKFNVLCVSDEVYEWVVFDSNKHIRIATLPGMWERTITIGSAGKTFGVTGWNLGWVYGPSYLLQNVHTVHQGCVYTSCSPVQEAVARVLAIENARLDKDDSHFKTVPKKYQAKRDFMVKFLTEAGMKPVIPEGGYFVLADWSPLAPKLNLSFESGTYPDHQFTKWMTQSLGIQGIPSSIFYAENDKHLSKNFVRYCFVKKDENLQKAANILIKWKNDSL